MLTEFICKDGKKIKCEKCLEECSMGKRCLPYPYLKAVSRVRSYTGKVSASQAGNGTRYTYLNYTIDFAEDPKDKAFTTLGTNHHILMEDHVGEGENGHYMEHEFFTGTPDYYHKKEKILWDFKTYKTYKIKKILGAKSEWIEDPSGETYSRGGRTKTGRVYKKGDPKLIEQITIDPELADNKVEALQLNAYRIMMEAEGYEIKEMKLCCTNKDYMEGSIVGKIEVVDIPFIDDAIVIEFFKKKTEELAKHMKSKTLPPICSDEERWGGKRCESYCQFKHICEIELQRDDELY